MIRAVLAFLIAACVIAAPAKVQTAKAQPGGTGTAINFTLGVSSTAGNVLVACMQNSEFGGDRTVSAPDGTWTKFLDQVQNNVQQTVWWKAVTAGATTYNFTVSGTAEWHSGVIWEISGAKTSAPINVSAINSATSPGSTTTATPNATPTVIGTLALGCLSTDSTLTLSSVSAGWTIDQEAKPSFHATYGASKDALTVDTTTAITTTFTTTANASPHVGSTILVSPADATRRRVQVIN